MLERSGTLEAETRRGGVRRLGKGLVEADRHHAAVQRIDRPLPIHVAGILVNHRVAHGNALFLQVHAGKRNGKLFIVALESNLAHVGDAAGGNGNSWTVPPRISPSD